MIGSNKPKVQVNHSYFMENTFPRNLFCSMFDITGGISIAFSVLVCQFLHTVPSLPEAQKFLLSAWWSWGVCVPLFFKEHKNKIKISSPSSSPLHQILLKLWTRLSFPLSLQPSHGHLHRALKRMQSCHQPTAKVSSTFAKSIIFPSRYWHKCKQMQTKSHVSCVLEFS